MKKIPFEITTFWINLRSDAPGVERKLRNESSEQISNFGFCCGLLFGNPPYLIDLLSNNSNKEDWAFLQIIFNSNMTLFLSKRSSLCLKTNGYGTQCQLSCLGLCGRCGRFERANIDDKKTMLISFLSFFGIDFRFQFAKFRENIIIDKFNVLSLRFSSFESRKKDIFSKAMDDEKNLKNEICQTIDDLALLKKEENIKPNIVEKIEIFQKKFFEILQTEKFVSIDEIIK